MTDRTDLDAAPVAAMTLSREQMQVHLAWQVSGRVRISRTVVTERRTIEVEVRREQLHVEQLPVTDANDSTNAAVAPGIDTGSSVAEPLVFLLHEEVVQPLALQVQPYERVTVYIDRVVEDVAVSETLEREQEDVEFTQTNPT